MEGVITYVRSMTIDFSTIPSDDNDAARRAATFAHQDPLPSVPCALLSSAEIDDYARLTGMLFPYYAKALKSASYEAHIGGRFIWWDEHDKHDREIRRGDRCVLPANSITFVQVEPTFRLPDYIAVRFNLRITHVHRGLLLGTGPLVDPGFEGKLLIPLHNLTSSEYDLDTTEALIWIEFTKTTYGFAPNERIADTQRNFVPFPTSKKNLTPDYYLRKANAGNSIQSSIPIAVAEGHRDAASASRDARRARNTVVGISLGALAALIAALAALYLQVGGMIQSSLGLTSSVEQTMVPLATDQKATADKVDAMQRQISCGIKYSEMRVARLLTRDLRPQLVREVGHGEFVAPGGTLMLKSEPGPPMTLGNAATARVRLIVWCRDCRHQVEPDPAEQAQRYGAEMTVPEWRDRLVCSKCGSREIDMVVTGTERRI